MKKAIFILAAVVVLFSGVAAVSAYEAHVVNVTAHVENAMVVDVVHIDFGTAFPEEWMTRDFTVGMSDSFCNENQWRVTGIEYTIFVEWKPDPAGGYYPWLGDAMFIGIDAIDKWPEADGGDLVWVGAAKPSGPPGAIPVVSDGLLKIQSGGDRIDTITVGIDVPVFEGYYNAITDAMIGMPVPTVVIPISDTARYHPDGVTLGVDIKIQITNIYKP